MGLIWLIGGSEMARPMCLEIKAAGYDLLLTDGNAGCTCRKEADYFEQMSVYDADAHLEMARRLQTAPAAVITIGTDAGVTVSAISKYFDLPGVAPVETAMQAKNKIQMRQALPFSKPHFAVGTDAGLRYPVVAKPPEQSGSRGVEMYYFAPEESRLQNKLVEEYVFGANLEPELAFDTSEVAVDCWVEDSKVHYLNGALRLFWTHLPGIEAGHVNPFRPDDDLMGLIRRAAAALGVSTGFFKCDLKWDGTDWVVLECATRLSGGFDHSHTARIGPGKNVTAAALNLALGGRIKDVYRELTPSRDGYGCVFAPLYKPGQVRWPSNVPPGVIVTAKEVIYPLDCNQSRPLFAFAAGDSPREAVQNAIDKAGWVTPAYIEGG